MYIFYCFHLSFLFNCFSLEIISVIVSPCSITSCRTYG